MFRSSHVCCVALLALGCLSVHADDDQLSVGVGVSYGRDDNESEDKGFSAYVQLPNRQRLMLSATYFSTADIPVDQYTSVNYALTVATDPYEPISNDLSVQYWEDPGDVSITSLDAKLGYNTENYTLFVRPQMRTFTVTLSENGLALLRLLRRDPNLGPDLNFYGRGLAVGADYYFVSSIHLGVELSKQDYSANLEGLNQNNFTDRFFLPSDFFSDATLNSAYSLESQRVVTNLSYDGDNYSINSHAVRSWSAVDSSVINRVGLSLDYSYSSMLLVSLHIQKQFGPDVASVNYLGGGLTLNW